MGTLKNFSNYEGMGWVENIIQFMDITYSQTCEVIVAGPKPCVNKSPTKLQIMITEKGKEKGRLLETQNLCSRVQLLRYSCFADGDKDA